MLIEQRRGITEKLEALPIITKHLEFGVSYLHMVSEGILHGKLVAGELSPITHQAKWWRALSWLGAERGTRLDGDAQPLRKTGIHPHVCTAGVFSHRKARRHDTEKRLELGNP
jgi:hypothetical protein